MTIHVADPHPDRGGSLTLISSRLRELSKAERRIAERILEDPADAVRITITELADQAGVGEATVSRFCRRLGLSGFQDLKISIATELSPAAMARDASLAADPSESGPRAELHGAARQAADLLDRTAGLLDSAALDSAVHTLARARRIDLYGQGASAVTALDAQHALMRLGLSAHAPLDTHTQAMSAALLRRGDVSLAFSHTGSSRDVVASQRLARDNGADTICVTGAPRSPLAEASTIVLVTASENTLVSNLRSKMVQTFVLELLVKGCARALGTPAQLAFEQTTAAVLEKMY